MDILDLDKKELFKLAATEDATIDPELKLALDITEDNELEQKVAIATMSAVLNPELTQEAYKNNIVPVGAVKPVGFRLKGNEIGKLMTKEEFSSRTPDSSVEEIQQLNKKLISRSEFAETIFPTIIKPAGTTVFYAKVVVGYSKASFTRNTGSNNIPEEIVISKVVNQVNGLLGRNDSQVIPVVGVKTAFDAFMELDFKEEATEPQTGDIIETAPIKIGTKVPYLDLCQSATAASQSLMTDKTFLDSNARLDKFAVEVGTEKYWFDIPGRISFGESFSGDSFDIELSRTFRFSTILTDKEMIDNTAGTEFAGAANVVFVYEIFTTGKGNATEKELSIYVNSCTLVDMLVGGKSVPSTDANYATYKAVGDKFTISTIKGVVLETYISNEDMYRVGKKITLKTKTVPYGILPTSPYTVVTPARGLGVGDSEIIDGLTTAMLPEANLDAVITLLAFASSLKKHGVNGILPKNIETSTIGQAFLNPYYASITLDLSTDMNSLTSKGKKEDIPSAIELNAKALLTDMLGKSGLGQMRITKGKSIDIIVACSSIIGNYINPSFDLGSNVNFKIVTTPADEFEGKFMLLPGNFQSDRNTVTDFTSFGAHIYTPVLLAETISDKSRESTAHLFATNSVFCPIMVEIDIVGLTKDGALGNTVQNTHEVP